MCLDALDVYHCADTTVIMLKGWIIQTLLCVTCTRYGKTVPFLFHLSFPFHFVYSDTVFVSLLEEQLSFS